MLEYGQLYQIFSLDKQAGTVKILNTPIAKRSLLFLKELLQSYIDSYYLVLTTINCLLELGITLDQKKLTGELHLLVQDFYEQK